MHEEVFFPEHGRFTIASSPYDYKKELEEALKVKGEKSLVDEIERKIKKNS